MAAAPADDQAFAPFVAVPVDRDAGVGALGADGDVVLEQERLALIDEGVLMAVLALGGGRDELLVVVALGLEGVVPAGADAADLLPAMRQLVEGLEECV